MVVLRVFQPFPHHHCKIVSSGKNGHTYLTWSPNTSFWSPPLTSTRPEWRKNERKFSADASWRVLQLGVCLCVLKSTVPHVKNTDLLTLWQGTGVGGQKNKTVGTTSDRLHWRLWAFYFCRLTWKLTILFLQTHLETDRFFSASGVDLPQHNQDSFHYHLLLSTPRIQIISKVDHILTKDTSYVSPLTSKTLL
jgi:hypothetical protein